MHISRKALTATIAVVMLAGCATTRDRISVYTGADSVADIEASAFVGTWDMTILNPREGQEVNPTIVTYSDDGSFNSVITPEEVSSSALGNAPLNLSGNWSTADGVVSHHNVELSAGGDDPAASFITQLLNSISRDFGGSANVYEVSATHVILVGEDGVATRYDRR